MLPTWGDAAVGSVDVTRGADMADRGYGWDHKKMRAELAAHEAAHDLSPPVPATRSVGVLPAFGCAADRTGGEQSR